jgi:pimeloyl-ACP methyl ester carboxylesterase
LLKKLEIDKASFVGFSMGGAVSFKWRYHPELVDKLIIVNSGPDF